MPTSSPTPLTPAQLQALTTETAARGGWGTGPNEGDPAVPGYHRSALFLAVDLFEDRVDLDLVRAVLDTGCPVNWQDPDGMHVLFWTGFEILPQVLPLLLERGLNVNQPSAYGMTALADLASPGTDYSKPGWLDAVEALLEAGADPYLEDDDGESFMGYVNDLFPVHLHQGVEVLMARREASALDSMLPVPLASAVSSPRL
jgi:hypothetical protein